MEVAVQTLKEDLRVSAKLGSLELHVKKILTNALVHQTHVKTVAHALTL
jgi:hypothetical protein